MCPLGLSTARLQEKHTELQDSSRSDMHLQLIQALLVQQQHVLHLHKHKAFIQSTGN